MVTLNAFITDTEEEIDFVRNFCKERNCEFALSQVWEKGGEGGIELAKAILNTIETKESNFKPLYDVNHRFAIRLHALQKKYMVRMK